MADCFIIMPISTPDFLVPTYLNDKDHFQHVLECLFIPAIEKVGLKPIPPIAKGADIIHAGIVQNLEKADIVLCDMSSLNANVFFELGIRTAIGKPVCIVKDDATPKVPFDMTVVNYHTYASSLPSWRLNTEIEFLATHLKSSLELSAGENTLWKYFSLSQRAQLSHPKDVTQDRLAMLSVQVEGLSRKLDMIERPADAPRVPTEDELRTGELTGALLRHPSRSIRSTTWTHGSSQIGVELHKNLEEKDLVELQTLAAKYGKKLIFSTVAK